MTYQDYKTCHGGCFVQGWSDVSHLNMLNSHAKRTHEIKTVLFQQTCGHLLGAASTLVLIEQVC